MNVREPGHLAQPGPDGERRGMKRHGDCSGFFPFGWIREFRGDNWQILWNKKTGDIFLKATAKNALAKVASASSWTRAKEKADSIMENPDSIAATVADD